MSELEPEPIPEDCRTLADFYPDKEQRGQLHYLFIHRFLPAQLLVPPKPGTPHPLDQLAADPQVNWSRWAQFMWHAYFLPVVEQKPWDKQAPWRRVSDLRADLLSLAGKRCLLFTPPLPEGTTQAFFSALIFGGDACRYITLEKTVPSVPRGPDGQESAVICEWSNQAHLNSGILIPALREHFVRHLNTVAAGGGQPVAAGFTPPRDGQQGRVDLPAASPGPRPRAPRQKPWWKFW